MGYTHYWSVRRDFTEDEWETLRKYAESLLQQINTPIAGPMGTGLPEVDSEIIALNGIEAGDQCHESFLLPRCINGYDEYSRETGPKFEAKAWTFCKTARKPYDAVVIRILAAAQQVAPGNLSASSDGGNEVFTELGTLIT